MNFYDLIFKGEVGHSTRMGWWENILGEFIGGVAKLIAKFLKIKGNTVVWNQLITARDTRTINGMTFTKVNSVTITAVGTCESTDNYTITNYYNAVTDHVYLAFVGVPRVDNAYTIYWHSKQPPVGKDGVMYKSGSTTTDTVAIKVFKDAVLNLTLHPQVFDLTAMFGSTKADEIYAMEQSESGSGVAYFRSLYPLSYYQYNVGSLLSFNGEGIKTVGFNQWDEEWEQGSIDTATGQPIPALTQIRSKNFIPVIESEYYYYKIGGTSTAYLICYDADFNFNALARRTSNNSTNVANYECYLPTGTKYIKFRVNNEYGGTYKNDICINISDPSKNGTYEPYQTSTSTIPTSTYFPNGMMGWGTAFDEMTNTKAIHRMAEYTFTGNESWTASATPNRFSTTISNYLSIPMASQPTTTNAKQNVVTDKYGGFVYVNQDKGAYSYYLSSSGTVVVINDSSLSTVDDVKTATTGMVVQYETATEEVIQIDPSLKLNYQVWEGGTEQLLPVNTDTPVTTLILADIKYPDGERDGQYFTYRQYLPNNQLLGMALNTLMGKNVPFNQEALDILMKGE